MSAPKLVKFPKVHPWIEEIAPYKGGGFVPSDAGIWGLASNENLMGPSPLALQAYKTAIDRIYRYPEQSGARLKRELASLHALHEDNILLGNGSDEILSLVFRAYLVPGDEVVLSQNGFPLFPVLTQAQGAKAVMAEEKKLTTHIDNILSKITDKTKIICIANPNNPTGTCLPAAEILRLCEQTPSHILVILDSAYAEYVDSSLYTDGIDMVRRFQNVMMTRTFSKIYALAGLRLGWAYAHADIVSRIERIRLAFHINSIAQEVALQALKDQEFVAAARRQNAQWRSWLSVELTKIGLTAPETATNFLLVHFKSEGEHTAQKAFAYLKDNNILTRPIVSPHLKDCLRITIGPEEAMKALVKNLGQFLTAEKPVQFKSHGNPK